MPLRPLLDTLMKYFIIFLGTFCLFIFGSFAIAGEDSVKASVARVFPGVEFDAIQPSEVEGLYEVFVGPRLFYISSDGKYMLQGNLIDLQKRKNLTEDKLAKARLDAITKVGSDNMIIFKPEKTEYVVSIFTDIDCGYCRKLHAEIDQYLDHGITIQYLFYPRAGKDSESYNKAVSVWCAKDRNESLTLAKQGKTIENKTCDNPVLSHMSLGRAMGAKGTPMLVLNDGRILPGYAPADQLAKMLKVNSTASVK